MEIKNQLTKAIEQTLQELEIETSVVLEHPTEGSYGDYSTNIAMTAFKKFEIRNSKFETTSKWKSSMELAEEIVKRIKDTDKEIGGLIDKIEVAPPGFINFWLSPQLLLKELDCAVDESYGKGESGQTMVIDYSAPNIAKPFGIGHLRSTIIGQAIYNLYKFLGWKTIGDNHLGDWGTQFGILLYQVNSKQLIVNSLTIDDLEKLYVEFNKEVQEKPELRDGARVWFKKLEDGDPLAREVWEKLYKISLAEFDRIYKLLNVEIDYALGESFYEKMLPQIIDECVQKKIAAEDQGALIIKYENLPSIILRKSDGATTYLARDLATIKYRLEKWKPDVIVYEVGAEQELYFKQLFETAKLLGWNSKIQYIHIKHGLYLSPGGKKFSTRRGETVHLEDILEEAIERARKLSDKNTDKETAEIVGIGAVKYFDLSHHPATNIVFEWEKMFMLEGNSAPYLQYTTARCNSVLQRANFQFSNLGLNSNFKFQISNLNAEELSVLRHFYKFPEVVREAADNFSPNVLANFLFELAQKYNTFYAKHRVLSEKETTDHSLQTTAFRLAITSVTGNILRIGLGLLGIEAPERM